MTRQILIIEDDQDLAELTRLHLEDQGYVTELASDGDAGSRKLRRHSYDLILLDLMLPGIDGLDLCRQLRRQEDYTPLMILTARSSEVDRVVGLELGADDYLTKPVSFRELIARVKALFRRVDALSSGPPAQSEALQCGPMRIEPDRHRVFIDGRLVELTAKEFELLIHFARHPGQVFTRGQLLDSVWGYGYQGYEHTVNSHINRLRGKIETDTSQPRFILTVWGVGYKFCEDGSP